jgi:hypothetical protein
MLTHGQTIERMEKAALFRAFPQLNLKNECV